MTMGSLEVFDKYTIEWFTKTLGKPTKVQEEAWPAIASGDHTLVSAPTGTGKTLSAFLVFIDRFMILSRKSELKKELQLIYISPLKSLAGDIRENLRRPLNGILKEEVNSSDAAISTPFGINIAIRTGDTPQRDRRQMIKNPPHILITTPESLYLLLTSKSGQSMLKTANAIIIDELHALIDSKRGAHLMLSIARLDKLCPKPLQRIGLSATIEPLEVAAQYLAPEPVAIVAPKMNKKIELIITSPRYYDNLIHKDTIWHELANAVFQHCEGARSTIAFVEGRAYAERLAYNVNILGGEGFARTHHGSLSKEQRSKVEEDLRNGNIRLLCATSSMELGIDVGDIDRVFQIGCPRSISSTMQRLGRAGHNPDRTSVMHIFPRVASEGLYSGLTAQVVREGGIEYSHPPRLCLDVLAQHLVSMATGEGYEVKDVMDILPRAYPFKEVTREDVKEVLCMLAGDYEHEQEIPVRPRILYDRVNQRVEGDPYSRMLAVSAGGTIPDRGLFSVRNEFGVKVGEVDEEFVFEARVGDKFLLGTFAWQIQNVTKDTVIVSQSNMFGAKPPFYKGDIRGRTLQTGNAFGKLFRRLNASYDEGTLLDELYRLGLDEATAYHAKDFIERQIKTTMMLPDDKTIIIEHFRDDTGTHQMMVHSVFGRPVNEPLAILTQLAAKRIADTNIHYFDNDDGFLLFPYGAFELPDGLLLEIDPSSAREVLEAVLPSTSVFTMAFRYNSARALMMGVKKTGRQPLWVQRLRSAQLLDNIVRYEKHPLIRETKRECLEDYWDLQGVEHVLRGIRSGLIQIREISVDAPSPMSLPLRYQTESTMMYDYSPTTRGIQHATEEALQQIQMLSPSPKQLALVSERTRLPKDEKQLHSLLMIEGDLTAGELDVPIEWLEKLAADGRVRYIEPGLWIAAEHQEEYDNAFVSEDIEARIHLVRRLLRYRGAHTIELIAKRYLWTEHNTNKVLEILIERKEIVEAEGLFYHAKLYDRARQETIKIRRSQIKTMPAESYAALLSNSIRINAPANEQLEYALKQLIGQAYPAQQWENSLLPLRVNGYRPEMLDNILNQGNIYWNYNSGDLLSFHFYESFDWDADLSSKLFELSNEDRIIYEALLKRGASFMQRLSGLLEGSSPHAALLNLTKNGLVCADSFLPIRQLINKDALMTGTVKVRAAARAKAMTSGRFEVTRPLKELSIEQKLDWAFDKYVVLCRETAQELGLSWSVLLETLRVWEYTGRIRRGYFIEGMSGIQFIRDKEFNKTMLSLEQPSEAIIWLTAIDPAQPWGKLLPHMEDRSFINVMGTAVALRRGKPVAVFERQGKVLRVFEAASLPETLSAFVEDYSKRRIFTQAKRITVKQYPPEAAEVLKSSGFNREMQDYVLYRGY